MTEETREEYDKRIADAKAAFARNDERAKVHTAQIQVFGSDAIKAPAIVSAAGVAALLGFYSANYERLKIIPGAVETFNDVLFCLFASLLATVCAPGLAYFSQIAYFAAIYGEQYVYEHPFTKDTPRSRFLTMIGDGFRWATITLVALSIGFLAWGGFRLLALIRLG